MKTICRIIIGDFSVPKYRIRLFLLSLAILVILPRYRKAIALAAPPTQVQNDQYQLIVKTETAWDQANLHRDKEALQRLLAPEFVQINEDASVTSRDEAIEKLTGSRSHPRESKVEKRVIKVIGDTAILTALYTEVGVSPKGYYRVVLSIADVFRYGGGAWKGSVGYAHIVELKSGQPQPLIL